MTSAHAHWSPAVIDCMFGIEADMNDAQNINHIFDQLNQEISNAGADNDLARSLEMYSRVMAVNNALRDFAALACESVVDLSR